MNGDILNNLERIVVETDEENPTQIAVITNNAVEMKDGFRVRIKPIVKS